MATEAGYNHLHEAAAEPIHRSGQLAEPASGNFGSAQLAALVAGSGPCSFGSLGSFGAIRRDAGEGRSFGGFEENAYSEALRYFSSQQEQLDGQLRIETVSNGQREGSIAGGASSRNCGDIAGPGPPSQMCVALPWQPDGFASSQGISRSSPADTNASALNKAYSGGSLPWAAAHDMETRTASKASLSDSHFKGLAVSRPAGTSQTATGVADYAGHREHAEATHPDLATSPARKSEHAPEQRDASPMRAVTGRPYTKNVPCAWQRAPSLQQLEPYTEHPLKEEGGVSNWYRQNLRAPRSPKVGSQPRAVSQDNGKRSAVTSRARSASPIEGRSTVDRLMTATVSSASKGGRRNVYGHTSGCRIPRNDAAARPAQRSPMVPKPFEPSLHGSVSKTEIAGEWVSGLRQGALPRPFPVQRPQASATGTQHSSPDVSRRPAAVQPMGRSSSKNLGRHLGVGST